MDGETGIAPLEAYRTVDNKDLEVQFKRLEGEVNRMSGYVSGSPSLYRKSPELLGATSEKKRGGPAGVKVASPELKNIPSLEEGRSIIKRGQLEAPPHTSTPWPLKRDKRVVISKNSKPVSRLIRGVRASCLIGLVGRPPGKIQAAF